MSIETQIQTLTDAINNLAFIMQQQAVLAPAAPVAAPTAKIIPEPEPKPIPTVEAFPPTTISAAPSPVTGMPAPPFMVAAPVVAKNAPTELKAPFSDAKGLMAYMMAAWEALGPVKGLEVQAVMAKLGHKNVSDIATGDYDALFAGVEALK
jgi:hypothetical protein